MGLAGIQKKSPLAKNLPASANWQGYASTVIL